MRYPEGHKAATRDKIVAAAADALRREGLAGVGIPALMRKAGLTHGAFYGHFESREALVSAAVEHAAQQTARRVFAPEADLAAVLRAYLSPGHAAAPEQGCVIAALGTEARGQPGLVRRAFARGAKGLMRLVELKLRPDSPAGELGDDTLRLTATMVGAVMMARLVEDRRLAERILSAARHAAD